VAHKDLPPGARYTPGLFAADEAQRLLDVLLEAVPWERHTFSIFGRTVDMPRRIQMFGPHGYDYSGVRHPPRPLLPALEEVRARVEAAVGAPFNSVLANLYRDGADSMGWHTDDDYPHGGQPMIASVSLGATRRFRFRHRVDKARTCTIELEPGSLLVFDGEARADWQHALPRTARPVGPRINLTYRFMTGA